MRKIAVRLAASFDHERGRETEGKLFGHESLAGDVCLPNRPVTLARNAWNVKEKEEKERTDGRRDCPQARKQKAATTIKWPGRRGTNHVSGKRRTSKEGTEGA